MQGITAQLGGGAPTCRTAVGLGLAAAWLVLASGVASPARATEDAGATLIAVSAPGLGVAEGPVCEPPISLCGRGPLAFDPAHRPHDSASVSRACPFGYECTCVPSCPACADCPVQVCVPGDQPECRTACDCEPGLGCFEGSCIAGFAPVYCCDSDTCPTGAQCQRRDGRMDQCSARCVESCGRKSRNEGQ